MKQNRLIPFGYQVENGEMTAHPIEAAVVIQLFNDYLTGKSLQELCDQITVPYSEKAGWNSHRVLQVLNSKKYLGQAPYPKLIEPETYQAVQTLKRSKSHVHVQIREDIEAVRKLTVCKECGGKIYRYGGVKRAGWWDCKNPECGKLSVKMTDPIMLTAVQNALNAVMDNSCLLDTEIPETAYTPTTDIIRQQNEIRRMMESNVGYDRIKAEIYRLSEIKYRCCQYSDVPQKTERLKALLAEKKQSDTLDIDLLDACVSRILVSHFCTIEVEFINGVVISERGKNI